MPRIALIVLHILPAGMLAAAVARWPYGYYQLMRVVVCACAAIVAVWIWQNAKSFSIWVGIFIAIAIVFNPILPLRMPRNIWAILNIAAAALIALHLVISWRTSATNSRSQ